MSRLGRLQDFIYDEARLIDEKRLDEWFELFTDDAIYWMPLARGQELGDLTIRFSMRTSFS